MKEEYFYDLLDSVYNGTKVEVNINQRSVKREEGEVWEEEGKKWTIKNGIMVSVSETDDERDLLNVPYFCPCCEKPMSRVLDTTAYYRRGKCLSCVNIEESLAKIDGTYKKKKKEKLNNNVLFKLKEAKEEIEEFLSEEDNYSVFTETGHQVGWSGYVDKKELVKGIEEDIHKIEKKIKKKSI